MVYSGVPLYTPIGQRVLNRIEHHVEKKFAADGFNLIRIPNISKTADLAGGEEIGEKFAAKFMHVKEPLGEFHLLTTPEMMLIRSIGPAFSYSQLPMRLCYTTDFFRNAGDLSSFLVCRQFRIFGALGFEPSKDSAADALLLMRKVLCSVLEDFQVPVRVLGRSDGGFEVFFPTAEGDYRPDRLGIDTQQDDLRLLSLGMGYPYGQSVRVPARMRTMDNRNAPLVFSTFGLCTNRVLFSVFEAARTPGGFRLPAMLRPFAVCLIPRARQYEPEAQKIMAELENAGLDVLLDDRYKLPCAEREGFANMLGIPTCVRVDTGGPEYRSLLEPVGFSAASIEEIFTVSLRGALS